MAYCADGGKAIDVDDASLAVARRNLARFPAVSVEKQSAYEIGESDAYDIVFSIGVIHHLQFPERAIAQMVHAAKPGGHVLIWVYGYENNEWIVRFFDPLRPALFSRLMIACTVIGNIFMKLGASVPFAERPLFGIVAWQSCAGVAVFAAAVIIYSIVLQWMPLNVAQSFAAFQFVAVIVASARFLGEPIS